MAAIAIAEGAIRFGKKIFGGIKKRRAKRKARREERETRQNAKLASLENLLGGGGGRASTPVQAANADFVSNIVDRLQGGESVDLPVDVAQDAEAIRVDRLSGGGGNQNMFVMIGLGILALFLLMGRRR